MLAKFILGAESDRVGNVSKLVKAEKAAVLRDARHPMAAPVAAKLNTISHP
jgi:hypothetical protein